VPYAHPDPALEPTDSRGTASWRDSRLSIRTHDVPGPPRGVAEWSCESNHAAARDEALATLRMLPDLGVDFIDTPDSYGPYVSRS
jgi:aryl-alcohol dehydrogenase-like predicted oxidoreductase